MARAARRGVSASQAGASLLAGVVAAGLTGGATKAQPPLPPPVAAKPRSQPPDDGLRGGGFYLEADRLIQDEGRHTVTAEGSVEARYRGRVLRSDELDYDSDTGIVRAHGHVRISNDDGTSQFAD